LVLWAGWLLPEVVYFTFNSGLFHAYYLIMLGPPLAALVGATAWALWKVVRRRHWLGWMLLAIIAGLTLAFQMITLRQYPSSAPWIVSSALLVVLAGLAVLGVLRTQLWLRRAALTLVVLGLMVAPLAWSAFTALNENPDVALPRSGPDGGRPRRMLTSLSPQQAAILNVALANTEPGDYLLGALSSHQASPYILATERPVLTFGGFNGRDDVVDADELSGMVANGELRYVLGGGELARSKPEIGRWVQANCSVVEMPGLALGRGERVLGPGPGQETVLYDCGMER
jgi:4-amino-4-deoxy-L-arabinose transferase-like glycosyltransferase